MARCPKTAEEAWKRLDKRLSEEEKKANREAEDMVDFHFSLGMWIRNNWIYTGEKENLDSLMIDLAVAAVAGEGENRFVFYPVGDMASSAILDAYQKHLKE
jgi:hypothetical protein